LEEFNKVFPNYPLTCNNIYTDECQYSPHPEDIVLLGGSDAIPLFGAFVKETVHTTHIENMSSPLCNVTLVDSNGFPRSFVTLEITGFMGFVHQPVLYKNMEHTVSGTRCVSVFR
jgi:hypothetical protein